MTENSQSARLAVIVHVAGLVSHLRQNGQCSQQRTPTSFPRLGAVIALLILTGGGLAWWQSWKPSTEPASMGRITVALPVKPTNAVLPLEHMISDTGPEYFSDDVGEDLIIFAGVDVDERDQGNWKGWTALHRAANSGRTDVAELLIANGADVDPRTADFLHTPLFWAVRRGHRAMAELLISNGANVNAADASAGTPLHAAAMSGDPGIVQLLLANGADINAKTLRGDYPGETPLHAAAFAGNVDIAEQLLAYGAQIDATDQFGYTPLRRTVDQGNLILADVLIKQGADTATRDGNGVTLLHVVARKKYLAIAGMLIAAGVDINAMDGSGFTPLDYAQGDDERMVKTLRRHGATCTIC